MKKSVAVNEDKKWRAECDLRTLMDAKEIKADKKRMAAVKKLAAEKLQDMASVSAEVSDD